MTQIEALKLALEALENLINQHYAETTTNDDLEKADNAITAIKEALAQQSNEQVEPEPLLEFYEYEWQGETHKVYRWLVDTTTIPSGTKLYKHPPVPFVPQEHMAQPKEPAPEWMTEEEQTAYVFGWFKALEARHKEPEQEPVAWTDKADEWSDEIAAHHPFKTKAYKQWDTAMAMVGARHSKGALVELVFWLLQKSTPPQRKPLTDEQIDFLNFLYGAGEWDGAWFEGKHPTKKGAFWWRKDMKRLFDYGIKE